MKRLHLLVLLSALAALVAAPALQGETGREPDEEVTLIEGLDGGEYEPYEPALIERVQQELRSRGIYSGEVNGRLDEATMQAIGQFQEQNGIHVSGVPSPRTRQALFGEGRSAGVS